MGVCSSTPYANDPDYAAQVKYSQMIDRQLRDEKVQRSKDVKILLLGAGESGKTTVLKQMQILHDNGFSAEQRDVYRRQIFANLYEGIIAFLDIVKTEEIRLADSSLLYSVLPLFNYGELQPWEPYPSQLFEPLSRLWVDQSIWTAVARSNVALPESIYYFFPKLDRLFQPSFAPTDQDILRCRRTTVGITEMSFNVSDLKYRMFDVGGQRSERKKWIHCFEHVTVIIFLVAISGYDTTIIESSDSNQMVEALTLFDVITNSRWFKSTSSILFLNKIDLFKEKLLTSPVSRYFPDYKGGDSNLEAAQSYFTNRFLALNKSSKEIYTHYTCATDTELMRVVMTSVNDIILKRNLMIMLV